ncbi:MAG: hypothetical protein ACTTJ6_07385 [Treponema sp.]
MMRKALLSFILFFSISFLVAERTTYYVNPHSALPIVITRNADLDYYNYSYYILDAWMNPIYGSKKNPKAVDEDFIREKFFTSVEDYRKSKRVKMKWDYKDDKESEEKDVMRDGTYELHLIETKKFQKSITQEYIYYIVLDTLAPSLGVRDVKLSQDEVYKNDMEKFSLFVNESSVANSWRVFIDGQFKGEENFPYGEERRMPISLRQFSYEDYGYLPYGRHEIMIIAKDTAMNRREVYLDFELKKNPHDFSIFSNKEVVFKKDGSVKPLQYCGIGVQSNFWKATIKDSNGIVHYSEEVDLGKNEHSKVFEWDGFSENLNKKVNEGFYTIFLTCKDAEGSTYTQSDQFAVSEEKTKVEYIVKNVSNIPPISVSFRDDTFHLKMRDYYGKLDGAKLNIKKDDKIIFSTDILNAQDIVWDGFDEDGNYLLSTGDEYEASVEGLSENEFYSKLKAPLIFKKLDNGRKQIVASSIYFSGYEVDALKQDQYFAPNGQTMKKITEVILRALKPQDTLVIVGHANYTTYPNIQKMFYEKDALKDISLKRANAIKQLFMFYGVPERKIKIEGEGGDSFVVAPNSEDNWKNRRVEFFIESNENANEDSYEE